MDWIKCTDRMPPDMEPVMVTAFHRGLADAGGNLNLEKQKKNGVSGM